MILSKIRELRENRAKLADEMRKLAEQMAAAQTPEERKAIREKFDKVEADERDLKSQIDVSERAAAAEADSRNAQRLPESQVGAASTTEKRAAVLEFRNHLRKQGAAGIDKLRPESRSLIENMNARWWDAFRNYCVAESLAALSPEDRALITGKDAPEEFRDMGIGTNSLGGYFVPQGFVYDIEVALKYYGDMLNVAKILDTATGQPLPYPTANDTTVQGELVGEGQQVGDADVNIGHVMLGAYKYSTKMVKVSIELLQDSAFDIESFVKDQFAIRLGRILNNHFTVGTGSSQPNGIVTAAVAENGSAQVWTSGSSGPGIPLIAAGSAANDGGAETGGTSIGSQDFVNLEHSVDRLYRRGAKFMLHDTTLRSVKSLLDKYGRPLWLPGVAVNEPDTILGYEYSINNDMAQIGVNNVTVLFGQLQKYMIRRVKELGVMRLNERFADYGQIALIGFARYDGNLIDAGTHPVNYLKQAAS